MHVGRYGEAIGVIKDWFVLGGGGRKDAAAEISRRGLYRGCVCVACGIKKHDGNRCGNYSLIQQDI